MSTCITKKILHAPHIATSILKSSSTDVWDVLSFLRFTPNSWLWPVNPFTCPPDITKAHRRIYQHPKGRSDVRDFNSTAASSHCTSVFKQLLEFLILNFPADHEVISQVCKDSRCFTRTYYFQVIIADTWHPLWLKNGSSKMVIGRWSFHTFWDVAYHMSWISKSPSPERCLKSHRNELLFGQKPCLESPRHRDNSLVPCFLSWPLSEVPNVNHTFAVLIAEECWMSVEIESIMSSCDFCIGAECRCYTFQTLEASLRASTASTASTHHQHVPWTLQDQGLASSMDQDMCMYVICIYVVSCTVCVRMVQK